MLVLTCIAGALKRVVTRATGGLKLISPVIGFTLERGNLDDLGSPRLLPDVPFTRRLTSQARGGLYTSDARPVTSADCTAVGPESCIIVSHQ